MTAKSKVGNEEIDIKEFTKPLEIGTVFGVGLHKRVGDGNWIYVDLRYNLGLTDIVKDNPTDNMVKNNVISLNLAYTIPLGNN